MIVKGETFNTEKFIDLVFEVLEKLKGEEGLCTSLHQYFKSWKSSKLGCGKVYFGATFNVCTVERGVQVILLAQFAVHRLLIFTVKFWTESRNPSSFKVKHLEIEMKGVFFLVFFTNRYTPPTSKTETIWLEFLLVSIKQLHHIYML